eukprot:3000708-Rhodomonas_salina.2
MAGDFDEVAQLWGQVLCSERSSVRFRQVLLQTASTEQLWGGWLANLDNAVPNNGQAVDIGGRLVSIFSLFLSSLSSVPRHKRRTSGCASAPMRFKNG